MNDEKLIARLGSLEPPSGELARERAVTNVPVRLAAIAETAKNLPEEGFLRSRGVRYGRTAAAAAAICLVIAFFSLSTAPGRAVSNWVGERLGFGQPGSHPSLKQLRASWTRGTSAEGQPAYVLAVGPVPEGGRPNGGGRYEFITYWPRQPDESRGGGHWDLDEPCFELDLTQQRSSYGGSCGVLPEGPDLYVDGLAGNAAPGHELLFLSGRTSDEVASVQANLDGNPIPVELVSIPAAYIDRFHIGRPFRFFVGFLDERLHGGNVTVTALDASGKVLARRQLEAPDDLAAQRANCEWARDVLRKGEMSRKNALKNVRTSCARVR